MCNLHILLISSFFQLCIDQCEKCDVGYTSTFSFFQLCIDQCENCDVGCSSEINNYNLSFLWMWERTMYDNPCSLTLVGSKVNPSNDNPLDR